MACRTARSARWNNLVTSSLVIRLVEGKGLFLGRDMGGLATRELRFQANISNNLTGFAEWTLGFAIQLDDYTGGIP